MNPHKFDAIVAVKVGRWCELHQDERVKENHDTIIYCEECLKEAANTQDNILNAEDGHG